MLWDACVSRQMLDVIDLKRVVLHREACAVDARRVEACAIGYHGNSWAVEVLSIGELAGGGGAPMGQVCAWGLVDLRLNHKCPSPMRLRKWNRRICT